MSALTWHRVNFLNTLDPQKMHFTSFTHSIPSIQSSWHKTHLNMAILVVWNRFHGTCSSQQYDARQLSCADYFPVDVGLFPAFKKLTDTFWSRLNLEQSFCASCVPKKTGFPLLISKPCWQAEGSNWKSSWHVSCDKWHRICSTFWYICG